MFVTYSSIRRAEDKAPAETADRVRDPLTDAINVRAGLTTDPAFWPEGKMIAYASASVRQKPTALRARVRDTAVGRMHVGPTMSFRYTARRIDEYVTNTGATVY